MKYFIADFLRWVIFLPASLLASVLAGLVAAIFFGLGEIFSGGSTWGYLLLIKIMIYAIGGAALPATAFYIVPAAKKSLAHIMIGIGIFLGICWVVIAIYYHSYWDILLGVGYSLGSYSFIDSKALKVLKQKGIIHE